jgi:hypothetical protein
MFDGAGPEHAAKATRSGPIANRNPGESRNDEIRMTKEARMLK